MIYEATATNGIRKAKENLNDLQELQEFATKVWERGFFRMTVKYSGYGKDGQPRSGVAEMIADHNGVFTPIKK